MLIGGARNASPKLVLSASARASRLFFRVQSLALLRYSEKLFHGVLRRDYDLPVAHCRPRRERLSSALRVLGARPYSLSEVSCAPGGAKSAVLSLWSGRRAITPTCGSRKASCCP